MATVFGGEVTVVDGGPVVFVAGPAAGAHGLRPRPWRPSGRMPVSRSIALDEPFEPMRSSSWRGIRELTPRESEILALLAGGSGTRQIAGRLVISEKTVKTHVQNILRKLGAASRLEAAAIAVPGRLRAVKRVVTSHPFAAKKYSIGSRSIAFSTRDASPVRRHPWRFHHPWGGKDRCIRLKVAGLGIQHRRRCNAGRPFGHTGLSDKARS